MINLSPEEKQFLSGLLKEHLNYYRTLAGSEKCSESNRAKYKFIQELTGKLE